MNFNRTNHHRSFCAISACLIAIFGLNPSANAGRIYVDGNLTPCGDGIGWGTAFRYLQDALDEAVFGDEIWVAATDSTNPYRPDQSCANPDGTGDRTDTFQLVKGVFLLGGFDGTELFDYERDPILNVTILSGIVDHGDPADGCPGLMGLECGTGGSCFQPHGGRGCENSDCCMLVCDPIEGDPFCCCVEWDQTCVEIALTLCGESFHVVTAGTEIDDPEKTVIDGFLIRDGWANGSVQLDQNHGGGMFIEGEPSVVRCTITQNTASTEGGGITIKGDLNQSQFINSIIKDNPGDPANPGDQQVIPDNGGGLASILQADPIFTNCLFVGNSAWLAGGAILNVSGNCQITPPPGEVCGRITLINCTVSSNTANLGGGNNEGGGLHFVGSGRLDAENTIVWGNSPTANQIDGPPTFTVVNYSNCEGGCPGEGTDNIDVNPMFVDAPNGDYHLLIASLVIDAGNPLESVIPCDFFDLDVDGDVCTAPNDEPTPDLDLNNRVLDGDQIDGDRVDMGAYEFCHPDSCPWDLDGGGFVGAGDLLILLANWGNPYGAQALLELLAAWGVCPCADGTAPPTLADELADACLSQDDWDDFVDVMTDPNAPQVKKDRYLCWMEHYLFDCNKCICIGPSGCPNPDPFS